MSGELYPVSWSKIESYQTCPRQYYELRVARNWQKPEFEQQLWGVDVHQALEDNLMQSVPLSERFKQFQPMMDKLARIPGDHFGEQKLAVDIDLKPVDYDSEYAYARAIVDRIVIDVTVGYDFDYKTGKRKETSRQLDMSGAMMFSQWPDLQKVHSVFLWTQGGPATKALITPDKVVPIWDGFKRDIEEMEWSYIHDAWPAKPSGLCGPSRRTPYPGCPVLSCPHNRRPDSAAYRRTKRG